jgi:hypothetical protein
MDDHLAQVVEEIEQEKQLGRISAVDVFKGMLNQPELVSVSSANAQPSGSTSAYSVFTVNMPRPILECDTLQLLAANIPLCTASIPNTACVLWYYRTSEYFGTTPNPENLFFIRLLPSYYKPEFFQPTPAVYGQNVTFNDYPSVATQLALSCVNDLAANHLQFQAPDDTQVYQIPYRPSDVTVTYNSTTNKFVLTGLNTTAPLITSGYGSIGVYQIFYDGTYVYYYTTSNPRVVSAGQSVIISGATTSGFNGTFPVFTISGSDVGTWVISVNNGAGGVSSTATIQYLEGGNEWDATYTYAAGDYIAYTPLNGVFRSLQAGNINNLPRFINTSEVGFGQANIWWAYVDPLVAQWKTGIPYAVGQYAGYNAVVYKCIQATSSVDPTNAAYWVASTGISSSNPANYHYLVTGYDDPNVVALQGTASRQWTPYYLYILGSIVAYNNKIYQCILQNKNIVPTNATYWTLYLNSPTSVLCPIVGLNTISSTFDMEDYFRAGSVQQYPFPIGIPGQPFNPTPRRLLNSILGFCWNGVFTPSVVSTALDTLTSTATTTSDLLNRFRPVPQYYRRYSTGVSATPLATTSSSFTADGYANLVYTSVVAIYTTVVYGSTLDSQRNTNLIGLASMNAGNLGVSFFANFINSALRVKGADIYNISIELRDEMNEPYPVTNNGICTFTLKLTYKDTQSEK